MIKKLLLAVVLFFTIGEIAAQFPAVLNHTQLGNNGIRVRGTSLNQRIGYSMHSVGDFNNDSIDDFSIAAVGTNENYILFGGQNWGSSFVLSALTSANGLIIEGQTYSGGTFTNRERFISGAGDFNNDGKADALLGSNGANNTVYALFGHNNSSSVIHVDSIYDSLGFGMEQQPAGDYLGNSVAGGGDINGDGISDIAVGDAGMTLLNFNSNDGRVYVVFGQSGTTGHIDFDSLSVSQGMIINPAQEGGWLGWAIENVKDVNGDGLDDLLISADLTMINGVQYVGRVFLIYGSTNLPDTLNLSTLSAAQGVVINGAVYNNTGHAAGGSIGGGGDINGDGLADFMIGSTESPVGSNTMAGRAYVIFGDTMLPDTIELSNLTSPQGMNLQGQGATHLLGASMDFIGDVNNDGFGDFAVGSPMGNWNPSVGAGRAYVIFGRTNFPSTLNVSNLNGNDGFMFQSIASGGWAGFCVRGDFDFNADGISDLAVSYPRENQSGASEAGEVAIIYGRDCENNIDSVYQLSTPSCPGDLVTVKVNGYQGSSDGWVLRSDSCGGSILATTSGTQLILPLSETGTYYVTNDGGCNNSNSCLPITLEVLEESVDSISVMSCTSYTTPSGGQTTQMSGVVFDTLTKTNGCDSLLVIDVTVFPEFKDSISIAACESYTSPSGVIYSVSGIYSEALNTVNGCDSSVVYDVTITSLTAQFTVLSDTLVATSNGSQSQWIVCDSNGNIATMPFQTSDTLFLQQSGFYGLISSEAGCSDTTSCMFIGVTGLSGPSDLQRVSLYPNPTTGEVFLQGLDNARISVYDARGQLVVSRNVTTEKHALELGGQPNGVYFIQVAQGNAVTTKKVVVSK